MKESLPFGRTSYPLSKACCKQLNAYALAASAAGVGVLALVQPSEARIVYTRVHHLGLSGEFLSFHCNPVAYRTYWGFGIVTDSTVQADAPGADQITSPRAGAVAHFREGTCQADSAG